MSYSFKYNGHPAPAFTSNISGSGIAIYGPNEGRYITIFDVIASEPTVLRENEMNGPVIAYIPSGYTNLVGPITGGIAWGGQTGNDIVNTTGNVTINYSVQKAQWVK